MWVNGKLAESPADFKRRIREGKDARAVESELDEEEPVRIESTVRGFVRRLLRW